MARTSKKEGSLTAFPTNKENPFLKQAVEVVDKHAVKKYHNSTNTGESAILQAVDPQTGELRGITSFVRQIEVDDDQFVKLYLGNFQQFFELSTCAIRVFGFIIKSMRVGTDEVWFDLEEAYNYTKYKSSSTIYRGLAELVGAGIIARGKAENWYFINPMCIFNGNRINFVKSYVKKTAKNENDQQQVLPFDKI